MTRYSVIVLITSVNIILGWPCLALATGPDPDPACRSLAALYARTPESFDSPDLAALQACIGAALSELAPTEAPAPMAPPAPSPVAPQRVDRFKGVWPESAPWTTPGDPYPTVW